ncbi:MAG: DNA cytosine methyltransferase [Desertifilum sp.]|nr:DNA cytosine methyltransferase [Desertifilum sp.]
MVTKIGIASMFSGGGLADCGLKQLPGAELLWAVEYCPQISEYYRANHGNHLITAKVEDVDYCKLERPTILWASPECQQFSVANQNGIEGKEQVGQAEAIACAIETLLPPVVLIENVRAYVGSRSWQLIVCTLEKFGYVYNPNQVFNSADYGVPQTRHRLVMRAIHRSVYTGFYQPDLFNPGSGTLAPLDYKERRIGWYEAVSDLIETATPTKLANWQIDFLSKRLAKNPISLPALVRSSNSQQGRGKGYHAAKDPSMTVTANNSLPKALLVQKCGARNGRVQVKGINDPCFTIRALAKDGHWEQANGLLVLDRPSSTSDTISTVEELLSVSEVVLVPPRWLARFQTLPDSYRLPERSTLATKIIGNGVPCRLAYQIASLTLAETYVL